jgi:hypothetical protein
VVAPLRVALAPGADAAFTTRAGGVSEGPYASLNLATHVGDEPAAVATNRRVATLALGLDPDRVTWCDQVHGDTVATVGGDDAGRTFEACDGLVTDVPGVPLAVMGADCMAVLLADRRRGIVGAAHAGRGGLVKGVVESTIAAMAGLGARREDLSAALGPSIGACCYEVGDDVAAEVAAVLPVTRATTREGRTALDLPKGVRHVLAREGVRSVTVTGGCTAHEPAAYFSYRRDGTTGRQAGIVWRT